MKCVCCISLYGLSAPFLVLRIFDRDATINVYRPSYEVPVNSCRILINLLYYRLIIYTQIFNLMLIRPVCAEFFFSCE